VSDDQADDVAGVPGAAHSVITSDALRTFGRVRLYPFSHRSGASRCMR
jgi:hypothetical protein